MPLKVPDSSLSLAGGAVCWLGTDNKKQGLGRVSGGEYRDHDCILHAAVIPINHFLGPEVATLPRGMPERHLSLSVLLARSRWPAIRARWWPESKLQGWGSAVADHRLGNFTRETVPGQGRGGMFPDSHVPCGVVRTPYSSPCVVAAMIPRSPPRNEAAVIRRHLPHP